MVITIKRKGHAQKYDGKKVYASVYSAALNCHLTEQESEKIAQEILNDIDIWVQNHKKITSEFIKNKIIETLKENGFNQIALMYKHHLDIC